MMPNPTRIAFQSSLPRSGSTLLSNIVAQNPEFHVTPTSGLLDLLYTARSQFSRGEEFKAQNREEMERAFIGFCRGGLGQAVESSGAVAAALSAIPEVSLQDDEPVRCGVGTGGYGSQYALSAGCAVRVGDRLHLNGALAYTPSVDYEYGSTPSVAGRLGFSFPLGRIAKASTASNDISEYRSEVNSNIAKLQSDVASRDQQIDELKQQLDQLLNNQTLPENDDAAAESEATTNLIALLKSRIEQLETEKRQSEAENARQDQKIQDLEDKLEAQESMFKRMMNQLKSLMPGQAPANLGNTSQASSTSER